VTSPPNPALNGRVALVTGAASGVGRAIAVRLAEQGAEVLALDNDRAGASSISSQISGEPLVTDLTSADAIASLDLPHRAIDVLVNCAGIQHVAPIEEFDPTTFDRIHRLMLHAPFLLARAVLPGMYERGWGRMIHVSSIHGHRASAFKSAYVSANHGLEGLSKVIAIEGAAKGVTSNTIAPGYVRTPLVEGQISDQARRHGVDEDDVVRDILLARSPVKRLITSDEVAGLVAYLCGPGTESISGTSFILDGGWSAT